MSTSWDGNKNIKITPIHDDSTPPASTLSPTQAPTQVPTEAPTSAAGKYIIWDSQNRPLVNFSSWVPSRNF